MIFNIRSNNIVARQIALVNYFFYFVERNVPRDTFALIKEHLTTRRIRQLGAQQKGGMDGLNIFYNTFAHLSTPNLEKNFCKRNGGVTLSRARARNNTGGGACIHTRIYNYKYYYIYYIYYIY